MRPTAKNLELFDKWYESKTWVAYGKISSSVFFYMPEEMQLGVYLRYYEEEYGILMGREDLKSYWIHAPRKQDSDYAGDDNFESYEQALKEADKIVNGKT